MVTTARSGRSRLGCLVTLLLVAAAGYFAVDVAEAYLRNYQFQDAMTQEARFAHRKTDAEIARRLQAKADSLGLPSDAADVNVERADSSITISSEYTVPIRLPFATRRIAFHPRAERAF